MIQHLRTLLFAGALALSAGGVSAAALTDVTVYGSDTDGHWAFWDIWETRPGNNFNIWIRDSFGTFLNGPTDGTARPNISLPLGTTSFTLYTAPGIDMPYFGIN